MSRLNLCRVSRNGGDYNQPLIWRPTCTTSLRLGYVACSALESFTEKGTPQTCKTDSFGSMLARPCLPSGKSALLWRTASCTAFNPLFLQQPRTHRFLPSPWSGRRLWTRKRTRLRAFVLPQATVWPGPVEGSEQLTYVGEPLQLTYPVA